MTAAFYILLAVGQLGAFDVLYFHRVRCRLHERPEAQREVLWHTARHLLYGFQFIFVANLRFRGALLLVPALFYAADVFVAWSDVWEETESRRGQGGLPRGEYLMHVILSVLVGIYLCCVGQAIWPDRLLPAGIAIAPPPVPALLRAVMTGMGVVAIGFFVHDLRGWLRFRRAAMAAS